MFTWQLETCVYMVSAQQQGVINAHPYSVLLALDVRFKLSCSG